MSLKLMYITNRPDVAQIAECAGVDRVFVDMEYIGKDDRQGGMNTVQNHHTIDDIKCVRQAITNAQLLVRVNPIHEATEDYCSSQKEIDASIEAGADILMLPFFKTVEEVQSFVKMAGGRVRTMLLLETPEAVEKIDEILAVDGVDEIHIGLNDLSLGYKKKFMFELLCDGTVEELCYKFRKKGIPFGVGGIAGLGKGQLPAERIITEHYRLGSTCAILSRSFCNTGETTDLEMIRTTFMNGVREIRAFEKTVAVHSDFFVNNMQEVKRAVQEICGG